MQAQLIDFQYQVRWPLKYFNAPTTFETVAPQSLSKEFILSECSAKTYKVAFLGDFMGIGQHEIRLSDDLKNKLSFVDTIVINLESVIINSNGFILSKQYTSVESFRALSKELPMNKVVFGVANNHLFDFKQKGVDSTLNEITRAGARFIGTQDIPSVSLRKDLTIGASTLWHRKDDSISNKFDENKKYSINFLHWGDEFISRPNQSQIELAKKLSKDSLCLIGHHSHTPQAISLTNKMPTAYSLGNFCTSFPSAKINHGLVTVIEFAKTDSWKVVRGQWDFINIQVSKDMVDIGLSHEGEL